MKKLFIALTLATLAFVLAACGGNAPTTTTPATTPTQQQTPTPAPETTVQDIIDDITEQLEDAQEVVGTAIAPGSHFTFGDNFILWDTFDITFGAQATISLIELAHYLADIPQFAVYNGEYIVMIPTRATNISGENATLFSPLTYRMLSPGDEVPNTTRTNDMNAIFSEDGIGRVSANPGVAPGQTVDFYIHILYTHDGDYIVTMEGGALGQVVFRFPVTMP